MTVFLHPPKTEPFQYWKYTQRHFNYRYQLTPDFIQPTLWPPNSPDLNPVDYKIWGLLQNRVYQTHINDVEHLKQRLQEEWSRFDQSVIDHAINEWRSRLRACVKASGGHFEHTLQ